MANGSEERQLNDIVVWWWLEMDRNKDTAVERKKRILLLIR